MRVEMETPNQPRLNTKGPAIYFRFILKWQRWFSPSHQIASKENQTRKAWRMMEEPIQAIYEPCLKEISSLQTFPEGILGLICHNRPSEYQKSTLPLDPVAKVIIPFVVFVQTINNTQYRIYTIYNYILSSDASSPIERHMSSLWKVSLNLGRMRTKMLAKFPGH